MPENCDVDDMFSLYNETLRNIADRFASVYSIRTNRKPISAWFDQDCQTARRTSRRLERKYKRARSQADLNEWVINLRNKFGLLRMKKDEYWKRKISSEGRSGSKMWRIISQLLEVKRTSVKSTENLNAESFAEFFHAKV